MPVTIDCTSSGLGKKRGGRRGRTRHRPHPPKHKDSRVEHDFAQEHVLKGQNGGRMVDGVIVLQKEIPNTKEWYTNSLTTRQLTMCVRKSTYFESLIEI